jgi:hypothetical protein
VLVRTLAPQGVPTWLNEGLAVLFENGGEQWADRTIATASRRLPYSKLNGSFAGLGGRDARLAYAQSALAAQRLVDLAGTPAVVALLQDLAQGEPFERAFERRTLIPYSTFIEGLEAHP